MMRIDQVPAPPGFKENVALKGRTWLKSHLPPCEPKDLWNTAKLPDGELCKDALCRLYHGICAYSLVRILPKDDFQVDHFLPKSKFRDLAYDWDNFRLASTKRNGCKGDRIVSDPFQLPKDACFLNDKCEIRVNRKVLSNNVEAELLQNTIDWLRLNADCARDRLAARKAYLQKDPNLPQLNMAALATNYPFVAYEIMRQGLCRAPEDEDICRNTLRSIGFSWV